MAQRGASETLPADDESQIRNLFHQIRRKARVEWPMGMVGDAGGGSREEEGGGSREEGAQEVQQEVDLHFQQACSSLSPFLFPLSSECARMLVFVTAARVLVVPRPDILISPSLPMHTIT